eukprot:6202572-Pleurochrysis_carterae.AAC.3
MLRTSSRLHICFFACNDCSDSFSLTNVFVALLKQVVSTTILLKVTALFPAWHRTADNEKSTKACSFESAVNLDKALLMPRAASPAQRRDAPSARVREPGLSRRDRDDSGRDAG